MPTPLVYGDYLYVCRDQGALFCLDARSGEEIYQQRIHSGAFTASPVAADGKLYLTGEQGVVYVVRTGPEYKLLAKNSLDEIAMATPAISEGVLYFRTRGHLVAVGEAGSEDPGPSSP
ncbi:MAG: PQQ-binding-like beta-propeller repeat protein [bacterium]|nr:PQQ-binding-like beta-propeller repeat protein [bacterium]